MLIEATLSGKFMVFSTFFQFFCAFLIFYREKLLFQQKKNRRQIKTFTFVIFGIANLIKISIFVCCMAYLTRSGNSGPLGKKVQSVLTSLKLHQRFRSTFTNSLRCAWNNACAVLSFPIDHFQVWVTDLHTGFLLALTLGQPIPYNVPTALLHTGFLPALTHGQPIPFNVPTAL